MAITIVCARLTGKVRCIVCNEWDNAIEPSESNRIFTPWQLMEWIESIFVKNGEELLLLTDLPYMYDKAVAHHVAALPIALAENRMAAFDGAEYLLGGLEGVDLFYLNRIYQRHHNIPWQILETERTIVREMTVDDVDALYDIYKEPSITMYTDKLFDDPNEEKAYTKEYIAKIYRFMEFGVWIVEDKYQSGHIIGRAGLSLREGFEEPELGYVIAVAEQKKGYATEVCQAIIDYAKEYLEFRTIRAIMTKDNEASRRLCTKLNFAFDRLVTIDGIEMEQYCLR
jgi:RimJ/RimL family protein N-acetyltransferase